MEIPDESGKGHGKEEENGGQQSISSLNTNEYPVTPVGIRDHYGIRPDPN
jgi:hypothetical protein